MLPEDPQAAPETSPDDVAFRIILVVDVVDSVALYERIGDVRAKKQVSDCLGALARIVRLRYGQVVKSLGDGLLCSFEKPENPVLAALAMSEEAQSHDLTVHIGMHCGEVVEEDEDVFGNAVNTASRIAGLARPSEILMSSEMVAALPRFIRCMIRPVQPVAVKGRSDPIELFTLLSGDFAQTIALEDVAPPPSAHLEVCFEEQTWRLEAGSKLTIGRDPTNDLVIDDPLASRLHAKVINRQGKFFLVDHSANGTYLVPDGEEVLHLLREEALLHGAGRMHPGAPPDKESSPPIHFASATPK